MLDSRTVVSNPETTLPIVANGLDRGTQRARQDIEHLAFDTAQAIAIGAYPQTVLAVNQQGEDKFVVIRQAFQPHGLAFGVKPVDSVAIGAHDEITLRILTSSSDQRLSGPGI